VAAFEYQAIAEDKRNRRGIIQADTARAARAQLREAGLIPLEIQEVRRESRREFSLKNHGRERALLLRQLATLLKAGLTLEEVLSVLVEQTDASQQRRQLGAIRSRVMEGQSLSVAMGEHPALFPALYSASVAAGERAGQVEDVLSRLADYAEQRDETSRNVGLALIYPAVLAIIAIGVVWGLIGFVVPRVVGVFDTAGQSLPTVTQSLLTISNLVSQHGLWLVLGLLALGAGIGIAWRQPASKLRIDRLLLLAPGLGRLVRASQTASFTRTLAILSTSAVPLVEALTVASRVVGNRQIQADIEQAARQVREGQTLTAALHNAGWLPPLVRRLIAGGERSGELAPMLEHAADIQERELNSATAVLLSVLQPALILVVGGLVLYIVLAIMLPILNMSQLLS